MKPAPTGVRKLPGLLRSLSARFGWGVADQALSSITNFAVGFVAARTLPSAEFGAFAIAFAAYLIVLGATRAVTSEPFVIRFAAVSPAEWRRGASYATGSAVAIGVLGGGVCIVLGFAVGGPLGTGLLALGITMPGLLLQDLWRFSFFAARRGSSAFVNDMIWGLALLTSMTLVLVTEARSVGWLVFAWGVSGTVAGIFGILQASVIPMPHRAWDWMRQQMDLAPRYLGEFSVTTGAGQITVFGLGAIAGLAEAGALRAGQLILGPLNVLFLGVSIVAVPEGVRALRKSADRLLTFARRLSVILAPGALAMGAVVWSLPDSLGTALLRDNWAGAHRVVIPLALGMAFFAFVLGAGVGLRSLAAARLSLRARLMVAPIMLVGSLTGATLGGALGAAWGGTTAFGLSAIIWWHHFLRGLREHAGRDGSPAPRSNENEEIEPHPEEAPYG